MLIVSIDDRESLTLYQSWWRHPEIVGVEKGSPEYMELLRMWESATGIRIPEEEYAMDPDYPTWYVNLWFGSTPEGSKLIHKVIEHAKHRDDPEEWLGRWLREYVRDNNPLIDTSSMYSDMLNWAMGRVDYYGLAKLLLED